MNRFAVGSILCALFEGGKFFSRARIYDLDHIRVDKAVDQAQAGRALADNLYVVDHAAPSLYSILKTVPTRSQPS